MSSAYCKFAPGHAIHGSYHDMEYGFPIDDERVLFERMALEIMQAGLSWEIVLKKRAGLNKAFDRFNVDRVAAYTSADIKRLLADKDIIRNRLKIAAIVENAERVMKLRDSHGGLAKWIATHHPLSKAEWVALFRKQFRFMGGEIVSEFLMSIGYLPGAHETDCKIYKLITKRKPAWMKA
jgi:DNA-3-methyladenine glycosylase I